MISAFFFYGIFTGFLSALFGIGIGCLLVPFYALFGIAYDVAIDASLMTIFFSSITNSIQHYKFGGIMKEPWVVMSISGAIAAMIGSFHLINIIPIVFFNIAFVILMFLQVDLMRIIHLKKNYVSKTIIIDHKRNFPVYVLCGFLAGLSGSLLGVGGNTLVTVLLVTMLNLDMRDASKTATALMIVTAFFSLSPEILHNRLPFAIGMPTAFGAIIGGFFGTIAAKYISPALPSKVNSGISFILGCSVLIEVIIQTILR